MPFPGLPERLLDIRRRIAEAAARGKHGQRVEIVAVTKTRGIDAVTAAWESGIRMVGENRVQEALSKMSGVSFPVEWHLIGHLQRNKVKQVAGFALIHSLDNPRLADAVHREGVESGRRVRVLVQVNTSHEESKGGYTLDSLRAESSRLGLLDGLEVIGAMTMAPVDASEPLLRLTFAGTHTAREMLRDAGHPATELSMGMSSDFEVAVEEGATMVRLGTILFGERGP